MEMLRFRHTSGSRWRATVLTYTVVFAGMVIAPSGVWSICVVLVCFDRWIRGVNNLKTSNMKARVRVAFPKVAT